MEIRKLDPAQYDEWDEFVMNNPDSIAWHLTEWNDVLQQVYQPEFLPFAAMEGERIRGVLPLYKGKTTFGKEYLSAVPYAVAGGIVADSDEVALALIEKAIEVSKQCGLESITFKQYKKKMPGDLRSDENYFNRELDLSVGESQVWQDLAIENKEVIEHMAGEDLKLEFPSNDLNTFYNLVVRHHKARGVPCPGRNWIQALMSTSMYQIGFLHHNDQVVAATMTKEFRDTVSFPFSSIPDMSETSVRYMYVLYWKLIQFYIEKPLRIFHSGRIPQSEDVEAYRLGWGGEKHTYFYQYYPNNQSVQTEHKKKRGKKREIAEACFRHMPLPIFKIVSPKIVSNFP